MNKNIKSLCILCSISFLMLLIFLIVIYNPILTIFNRHNNQFINANFNDGLKGWGHTSGVTLSESNGVFFACITGQDKIQSRIWQDVNTISGKIYRLTFYLSGPTSGAFAIYRENVSGKEQYLWCNGKNDNKKYTWDFTSKNTGKNKVYLSTNREGVYYYSNISFNNYNVLIFLLFESIPYILLISMIVSVKIFYFRLFSKNLLLDFAVDYNDFIRNSKFKRVINFSLTILLALFIIFIIATRVILIFR